MKVIDGIELLGMIKNEEVKADTEIKVWYDDGLKEYVTTLYFNGIDLKWKPNTFYARYFYNKYTKFEIIEEEKEIDVLELQENISKLQSEIDLLSNEIGSYHNKIHSMRDRNNYMKETLKDLQKEVRELNKIKKEGK